MHCVSLDLCNGGDTENPVVWLAAELVKFFSSVFDICGMSKLHTALQ